MNVACDYEAPMQMLTTEKYIAARTQYFFRITVQYCTYQLSPATEFNTTRT